MVQFPHKLCEILSISSDINNQAREFLCNLRKESVFLWYIRKLWMTISPKRKNSFHFWISILVIVFFLPPPIAWSSFELIPLSSRQEAMGGVSGGVGDPGALWLNPASAAILKNSYLTSTYTRWWGLSELSLSFLTYTHPFNFGNLSVGISNFGSENYRENIGCFSLAMRVRSTLDIGMNLKCMHRSIGNEWVENVISIDGGLIVNPIKAVLVEVISHNISSPTIGIEPIHQDLSAGFIYQPQEGLLMSLSLLKQPPYPVQLCVGEEFELTQWLIQRAGVRQNPLVMTFGFGIKLAPMEFDYAALFHPLLGTTHSFSLSVTKF